MRRNILLILIAVFILVGCATIPLSPGYIYKTTSDFDGATQWSMEPVIIPGGGGISLGLFHSTKMNPDKLILEVEIRGLQTIESCHWKVDGGLYHFSPINPRTEFGTEGEGTVYIHNVSIQTYWITKEFLEKILNAKEAIIRVDLENNTFLDGLFHKGGALTPKTAFKNYYMKVMENTEEKQ